MRSLIDERSRSRPYSTTQSYEEDFAALFAGAVEAPAKILPVRVNGSDMALFLSALAAVAIGSDVPPPPVPDRSGSGDRGCKRSAGATVNNQAEQDNFEVGRQGSEP
jgi:hypothetical protein